MYIEFYLYIQTNIHGLRRVLRYINQFSYLFATALSTIIFLLPQRVVKNVSVFIWVAHPHYKKYVKNDSGRKRNIIGNNTIIYEELYGLAIA